MCITPCGSQSKNKHDMSGCSMGNEGEGGLDSIGDKQPYLYMIGLYWLSDSSGTTCLLVCSAVFEAGGRLDGKASEKGLLQLLFDVRFLWDALSGGRALGDPQPDPNPPQPSAR